MNLFAKITDLDVTVRAKTICHHLNVETVYDLMRAELPQVGKSIYNQPLARVNIVYSSRVDAELREILNGTV